MSVEMFHLITAVVLVKNEEKLIRECVKSLSFCDEILIIDDNSTDATINVINNFANKKIKIIPHELKNNFSQARNFGLQKAQNEWVLFIDADEVVSDSLAYEISNAIQLKDQNLNNFNGFYIKRKDFMWGKRFEYGETGNIKLLRLAKKINGEWKGIVHEEWKIKGNVGILRNIIAHYPHQTIEEFLREINFYTTLKAEDLYSKKVRTSMLSIILYPFGKFVLNYFLKKGFLDGIPGLVHALLMSFHSFLVRGKLWAMWNRK